MNDTGRKKYKYLRPKSTAEILNNDSFERLKNKKTRRVVVRRISYVLISVVVCAIFVIVCVSLFFKVSDIRVEGCSRYAPENLIQASGIETEQNMYSISEKKLNSILTEKYPYINKVRITRELPSTLVIKITEDEPVFYTEIYGESFVLSNDMRVLENVQSAERLAECREYLIKISLPSPSRVVLGEEVEFSKKSSYDYMMVILDAMKADGIYSRVNSINASDKFGIYIIADNRRLKIILGDNSNILEKLNFMYAIMDEYIKENTIASIDVSYTDSAVATFENELFED